MTNKSNVGSMFVPVTAMATGLLAGYCFFSQAKAADGNVEQELHDHLICRSISIVDQVGVERGRIGYDEQFDIMIIEIRDGKGHLLASMGGGDNIGSTLVLRNPTLDDDQNNRGNDLLLSNVPRHTGLRIVKPDPDKEVIDAWPE